MQGPLLACSCFWVSFPPCLPGIRLTGLHLPPSWHPCCRLTGCCPMAVESCAHALHTSLLLSEAIPAALVLHHRPDSLFFCAEERQSEVPFALKEDQLCLGCAAPPQAPAQQTPVQRAVLYLTSQLGWVVESDAGAHLWEGEAAQFHYSSQASWRILCARGVLLPSPRCYPAQNSRLPQEPPPQSREGVNLGDSLKHDHRSAWFTHL